MRDHARTIALLERKAADPACTAHERRAFLDKAAGMRAAHGGGGAQPPSSPPASSAGFEDQPPWRVVWYHTTSTNTSAMAGVHFTYTTTAR